MVLNRLRSRRIRSLDRNSSNRGTDAPKPVPKPASHSTAPSTDDEDTHLNRLIANRTGEDISTIMYGESVIWQAQTLRARPQSTAELDQFLPTLTTGRQTDISLMGEERNGQPHKAAAQRTSIQRRPSGQSAFEENVEVFKYGRRRLLKEIDANGAGGSRDGQGLSTDMSLFCLSLLKTETAPRAKSLSERIVRDSLQQHLDLYTGSNSGGAAIGSGHGSSGALTEYITEPVDTSMSLSSSGEGSSAGSTSDSDSSYSENGNDDSRYLHPGVTSSNPNKLNSMAIECLKTNDYQDSIDLLIRLLEVQRKIPNAKTSETLSLLAILHLALGHLNRSIIFAKESLRQNREECLREEVSVSLMTMGLIYFHGNKMDKALSTWREAMQISCSVFGYDHPYVAVLLNNLGCLYYQQGDFPASLRSFSESLDLQKSFLKASSGTITDLLLLDIATSKGNMAVVMSRDGNTDSSMSLLEETLSLQESVLGPGHHSLIKQTRYNIECLGGALARPATQTRSHMFFSSSIAGKSSVTASRGAVVGGAQSFPFETQQTKSTMVFGDNDGIPMRRSGADSTMYAMQETDCFDFLEFGALSAEYTPRQRVRAAVLEWFGKHLQDIADHAQLPFVPAFDAANQRKRLRIPIDLDRENVVDAELYLEGIHEQAQEHLEYNEIAEAISLFESVLQSHKDKYGNVHHLVGTAHHNIGLVHMFDEKYHKAKKCFDKAAEIRKSALEADHPDVASSLTKIAMIHLACRDPESARDTMLEVSKTLPRVFGYNSIHVARALNNLALSHYDLGAPVEANRACLEAKDILNKLLIDDSTSSTRTPTTVCVDHKRIIELAMARTLGNLGFLESRRKKFKESVQSFSAAVKLLRRHLGVGHADLDLANRNLAHAKESLTAALTVESVTAERGGLPDITQFLDALCAYGV